MPYTSETNLLLYFSRITITTEICKKAQALIKTNIDWEYIIQIAAHHRVIPLLYLNISKVKPETVPDNVKKKLRDFYLANTSRNLFLSARLVNALGLLEAHNIKAIPFKGPVLAQVVYKDVAFRQFSDLDIIVSRQDAIKAKNLLVDNGYRIAVKFAENNEDDYIKYENFFPLVSTDNNVNIDLHWELSGRYTLTPMYLEDFVSRLGQSTLTGKEVCIFSTEDLLLYQCIHATSHCWGTLEMISCLAELITSNSEIDWDLVVRLADKYKTKRLLLLGLHLTQILFSVDLPEHISERIILDQRVIRLADKISFNLFNEKKGTFRSELSWRFSLLHFWVRDNTIDGMNYVVRLLTLPTIKEWNRLPLPKSLIFLLYFFRPIHLGIRYFHKKFKKN